MIQACWSSLLPDEVYINYYVDDTVYCFDAARPRSGLKDFVVTGLAVWLL